MLVPSLIRNDRNRDGNTIRRSDVIRLEVVAASSENSKRSGDHTEVADNTIKFDVRTLNNSNPLSSDDSKGVCRNFENDAQQNSENISNNILEKSTLLPSLLLNDACCSWTSPNQSTDISRNHSNNIIQPNGTIKMAPIQKIEEICNAKHVTKQKLPNGLVNHCRELPPTSQKKNVGSTTRPEVHSLNHVHHHPATDITRKAKNMQQKMAERSRNNLKTQMFTDGLLIPVAKIVGNNSDNVNGSAVLPNGCRSMPNLSDSGVFVNDSDEHHNNLRQNHIY